MEEIIMCERIFGDRYSFNIASMVLAVIVGIATFLPMMVLEAGDEKVTFNSILVDDEIAIGIYILVAAILVIVFNIKKSSIGILVCSAVSLIVSMRLSSKYSELSDVALTKTFFGQVSLSKGIGLHLLVIGSVLLLISAIIGLINEKRSY